MKLIAFTGYKQSGKDTAALELARYLLPAKSTCVNFADALKEEVARGCGVSVPYINAHKENFRLILQGWGTNFRRQLQDDQYWTTEWLKRVVRLDDTFRYVFTTDVRFLNEASLIREAGGILVRIVRPGIISDGHASEVEQDKIVADFTILNDSTTQDLRNKLKQELKL